MHIRPYSDPEYAVLVLLNLKRAIKHSDYTLSFIPPRTINDDRADASDVRKALEYAIEAVRYAVQEQRGTVSEVIARE